MTTGLAGGFFFGGRLLFHSLVSFEDEERFALPYCTKYTAVNEFCTKFPAVNRFCTKMTAVRK